MTEQRIAATIATLAKRRGRLPALVTALGVGALLSLQSFLASAANYFWQLGYLASPAGEQARQNGLVVTYAFGPSPDYLVSYVVPLVVGIFVALWLLAPISDELTLRFVLTRAGLASLAGAGLMVVLQIVVGFLLAIGKALPVVELDGQQFVQSLFEALSDGLQTVIFTTPVVLFAGVLLWLWLRDHPREYAVSGLIDEV